MIVHDHETYVGEFKNGLCHGKGILYKNDGNVYEGDWVEGE